MGARAAEIERRLAVLAPTRLEVIDDSDNHRGHAGHSGAGESHFTVRIDGGGLRRPVARRAAAARSMPRSAT